MSYFSKFPVYMTTAGYEGPIGSSSKKQRQILITDFFRRVKTGAGFSNVVTGIVPYAIKDGETPEMVAYNFYGSAFYHWVILLVNDIVNVREEWPMDIDEFNSYMAENYEDPEGIHHYIDPDTGLQVDSDFPFAVEVKNIEYETEVNNNKRNIKMLESQYLQEFVSIFDNLIIK